MVNIREGNYKQGITSTTQAAAVSHSSLFLSLSLEFNGKVDPRLQVCEWTSGVFFFFFCVVWLRSASIFVSASRSCAKGKKEQPSMCVCVCVCVLPAVRKSGLEMCECLCVFVCVYVGVWKQKEITNLTATGRRRWQGLPCFSMAA